MAFPQEIVIGFLRESGGSADMNVNGSITPVDFEHISAFSKLRIFDLSVMIIDKGIIPSKFGGLTALTSGLDLKVLSPSDTVLLDFLNGESIKTNADWFLVGTSASIIDAGAGDDQFNVGYDGQPLDLLEGNKIRVTVNDDLTGLTSFNIAFQGVR